MEENIKNYKLDGKWNARKGGAEDMVSIITL